MEEGGEAVAVDLSKSCGVDCGTILDDRAKEQPAQRYDRVGEHDC